MSKERIQKIIATDGLYSRRAVEKLIDERKIKVNGVLVTTKGIKVDPLVDRIQIDGKKFIYEEQDEFIAIVLNKPRRVMVTRNDPEGRKTIYDLLPEKYATLKPVGRLDYMSQGLLIMTNNGEFINHLTHPRYHVDKMYYVKLSSHPDEKQIERLRRGVILDEVRTLPPTVSVQHKNRATTTLKMILKEGKNRQIRRMCEAVGLTVKELRRESIGSIQLKNLRSGRFRVLTPIEIRKLKQLLKNPD